MHAAADGGLARIRVPGGRLTAPQLRGLAGAASAWGTGVIELTSRANVQVRGLGAGSAPAGRDGTAETSGRTGAADRFAARMAEAGLLPSPTHERVRNVLASPLTGCDAGGTLDAGPLVSELDRRLCARAALAGLPGRFLFALDDGRGDVAWLGPDAGILPTRADGAALILAGADSGLRVPVTSAVTALLAAAEAFLAEPAVREGRAWRIGELPGGAGRVAARVRATLETGAADPVRLRPPAERLRAGPPSAAGGPIGAVEQPDGRVALGVAVPLGRLTSAQAELLAALASGGEVRLTPWRGVVLPGLARAGLARTLTRLADAGLVTDAGSPWIGVTACTGRPGCAKSLADVRADAARATVSGPGIAPPVADSPRTGTLPVHWAGCERRCGRPRGRVADVVATGDGYRVDLDGRSLACADIEETTAVVTAARGET
ncbi:precorrin-3B synthase [Streptosporangium album]|uniref:Precorrin-3B synthase n=1 Tax=Streptosporangium album TaxID=47479 RepID=A0A7W7S3H1_9ACTN|nr:precorrin-3B synthase [Streptosporangium album]MBB4943160.1 precorrin-3B synthase [Streptosporangium album]